MIKILEEFLTSLFSTIAVFVWDSLLKCRDGIIWFSKTIGSFFSEFISFSDGNKIAIFCGITAIIAPYIIFIAELISSKEKDRSKTYKRIVLKDSWMFEQLIFIMFIFVLMFGASKETNFLNGIIIFLIMSEIIVFFWRFTIILSILKSSKFYKNRRIKYIEFMIKKYLKYSAKSKKVVEKNKNEFNSLQLRNVIYEKYHFDFNEEYEKIIAERDGIVKGIKSINLKAINNIFMNNIVGTEKINKQDTDNSKVIITCVDGEYIKKGYTIAYIPKKYKDAIEKFGKVDIKSERNNDEIITDIFRDYLDVFVINSSNLSSYLNQESYFDLYEFSCKILDNNDSDLISLLQDSIWKMRQNIDRNSKTAIQNVVSICKNMLIYDSKKEDSHYEFEKSMINIITYDSFELLGLCIDDKERRLQSKYYVQNIASFINYEFKNKKENIRNYFYTSISEYIKLVACSNYSEKVELIKIVINNLSFDRKDYDIWTVIRNKKIVKKLRSPQKIKLLNQNIEKFKYDIDLVNSFVLTTILAILYGNFEKNNNYYELLNDIVGSALYGYDLEELLSSYLNLNKSSKDIISKWGMINNPYDIVSDFNSIELEESLLLILNIADIHNVEIGEEFIDINYKYFFEGLIRHLEKAKEKYNDDISRIFKNNYVEEIIKELNRIHQLILKKEKNEIINARLNKSIILKFSFIISQQSSKNNHLYNYYLNNNLFINSRKTEEKYNGYNTVVDKSIMLSYDSFTTKMAEDYRDGLIDYKEKIIIESIQNSTEKIEVSSLENGLDNAIEKMLDENVNPKDILIVGNFMYSQRISKNSRYYKYNGNRYRLLNEVNTNNKIFVINKNSLPKLIVYKFEKEDLKKLNAVENNLDNKRNILVKISDLSHDKEEREIILKDNPDWLKKEGNKEEYIKTKILIMIFQKVDIQKIETNIGYYFDN